jgi:agmatine deiminase
MARLIEGKTPRELGYRMPAEWEQQSAVWLQWPGKYTHASDMRDLSYQMKLEKTWLLMAWEIHSRSRVSILAQNEAHAEHIRITLEYYGFDMSRVSIHATTIVDVWHRDSGPVFVKDDRGNLAITDWNFNGWGSYPEWGQQERHISSTVADILNLPVFKSPIVSEGGAIEVNGSGSILATRSSIINENRNPGMDQEQIEQALREYLNVDNFIWLSGAPASVCEQELGDATDYHVDIAARFAGESTVLYAWTTDQTDPRYPYLSRHLDELKSATDDKGNRLELVPVELPEGGVHVIGDRYDPALGSGSEFTDASYLNYLVTNDAILIPAFGNANDKPAQATLARYFPEHKIIPIPAVTLTAEGGAIHCVTQQQPAP